MNLALPHASAPVATRGVPLRAPDGTAAPGALVLFHGRGASAHGILPLGQDLAPDLPALAPQAEGGAWYPRSFLAPLAQNEPWLAGALAAAERAVAEAETAGVPRERIALVGFSQGACLALEAAARLGGRWGAVVAFSGGLIGTGEADDPARTLDGMGGPFADKAFAYDTRLDGTPVVLGCSDVDPHIPLARVERTADVLRALGADVDLRIYPGFGHAINADEVEAARALLDGMTSD